MQIEFASVQTLPRNSRWFSSAKSVKMQWNQSTGTREWAAKCSLRVRARLWGASMPGSSLQYCSNLLLKCPTKAALGAVLPTPGPALPFLCVLSSPVADCVTCSRWLKPSYEWQRSFARGWMKWKGKLKTFICHVISSYANMLPTLFLLSQVASSMNILITVKALSQETRKCALRGSWKQHVHIGFHCHCSICIVQDINFITDASPQLGKKTLSLN